MRPHPRPPAAAARWPRAPRAVAALSLLLAASGPPALAPPARAQTPAAGPSCDRAAAAPTDRRIAGDALDVAWRVSLAPAVGRPFAIEFALCPRGGASAAIDRVKVDAWMPAHRHGMNYAPTLSGAPGGPMRAEGLLFHMPGAWQVVFELRHDGRALRLVDDVAVR
ncbi:MAG: hypothetical protein INH05_06800 [Burkholderiales bacterium]|nr:hypothetical protein [Burkholderiales bacterium]